MRRFVSGKALFVDSSPLNELEVAAAELETLGFTPDEAGRLARFRVRASQYGEVAERKVVERRLEFIRWLLNNGRLTQ